MKSGFKRELLFCLALVLVGLSLFYYHRMSGLNQFRFTRQWHIQSWAIHMSDSGQPEIGRYYHFGPLELWHFYGVAVTNQTTN